MACRRRPRVAHRGKLFPGVPGAILYAAAENVCDVVWPVGTDACVVIEFPTPTPLSSAKRFHVVDPADASWNEPEERIYRRAARNVNLVDRESVSAFFAEATARRRALAHARQPNLSPRDREYTFSFKKIPDPDVDFAMPESLLRAAIQRPLVNFDETSVARLALSNAQHTLVVPTDDNIVQLYDRFFASTPELARAPFNWCDHPFAAAIAAVCTRGGGPVRFRRGAFVFDAAFFACVAARLPHILIAYFVAVRRPIWNLAKFVAAVPGGSHSIEFDTSVNSYVASDTREPVHNPATLKRRYVWVEPDELCGRDETTKRTRGTLVATFSRAAARFTTTTRLAATPVLPACMAHALHLESFPGLPPPKNDHYARARLAYLVNAISRVTGLPPLEAVDHSRYFASLRKDQLDDYHAALKQGDRNKMSGPLCRNTTHDVNEKGLTCVKCPRACGRPNNIPADLLNDLTTARPLTCMGIDIVTREG